MRFDFWKRQEHKDPVCGMKVDPQRAAGRSERDGVTHYFCSTSCKARFDQQGA